MSRRTLTTGLTLLGLFATWLLAQRWHAGLNRDLEPPGEILSEQRQELEEKLDRLFLNKRRAWSFTAEEALAGIPEEGLPAVDFVRATELLSSAWCVAFRSVQGEQGPYILRPNQAQAEQMLGQVTVFRNTGVWVELFPEERAAGETSKTCEPKWP